MLRAVPFTDSIADWIEKQFRSGILSVAKACYNHVFMAEFILASLGALRPPPNRTRGEFSVT